MKLTNSEMRLVLEKEGYINRVWKKGRPYYQYKKGKEQIYLGTAEAILKALKVST